MQEHSSISNPDLCAKDNSDKGTFVAARSSWLLICEREFTGQHELEKNAKAETSLLSLNFTVLL